jgi:hypothetical protein
VLVSFIAGNDYTVVADFGYFKSRSINIFGMLNTIVANRGLLTRMEPTNSFSASL